MTATTDAAPHPTPTDEELVKAATDVVRTAGRASTKLLQSELGIGYGRATRVLEQLETNGVVGPSDGHNARQVITDGYEPGPPVAPAGSSTPAGFALVDPAELLVDVNIRETRVDRDFVASIRELGVLVPIVAVRADAGALRVRYGHRRTLAAVEVGRETVPVVIADEQGADDADRIVRQWAENEHRAGLTNAERTAAIEQLSLLGVPAGEISKRTHVSRADVDHALRVAKSDVARQAVTANRDLNLEQAAALAEFEDDPQTVDTLLEQLDGEDGVGGFVHELEYQRQQRDDRLADDAKRAELIAAGVTVLDAPPDNGHTGSGKVRHLDGLADDKGNRFVKWVYDGAAAHNQRDVTAHATCDGHAGYVSNGGSVTWFCLDWKGYGHRDLNTSSGTRSGTATTSNDERREVIERNKQWKAATTVRRAAVKDLLTARAAPKGTAVYLAVELATHDLARGRHALGTELTYELLGIERTLGARSSLVMAAENASDARAQVIALGVAVSTVEAGLDVHSWRTVDAQTKRYLEFLAANGYTLSDVEKLAAGQKLGRKAKAAKS